MVAGLVVSAGLGAPAAGQTMTTPDEPERASPATLSREEFILDARLAAELYADRREAITDGFRRLGPDFPGMGEHWVQIGRIVSGRLEGSRPSVLCYVEIDGRPRLVGLAYTLPLRADEHPPDEPFGRDVWHDHSGEVSEESLLLSHPSSSSATPPEFRLSMLHVWIPLENPDGQLEQNNWRLPFLRVGLEPPDRPAVSAARGLSLASAGVDYYQELLYWGVGGNERDRAVIDRIVRKHAANVDRLIESSRARPHEGLSSDRLENVWHEFWTELEAELSEESFRRIAPLREGHE